MDNIHCSDSKYVRQISVFYRQSRTAVYLWRNRSQDSSLFHRGMHRALFSSGPDYANPRLARILISVFAFVKERFHNAVEIDILGIFEEYSSLQIWPPQKIFQGRNYSGQMTLFPSSTCFVPNRSRVSRFALRLGGGASLSSLTFSSRLVCFLVEFWTVLPCLFMFTNTVAYAF